MKELEDKIRPTLQTAEQSNVNIRPALAEGHVDLDHHLCDTSISSASEASLTRKTSHERLHSQPDTWQKAASNNYEDQLRKSILSSVDLSNASFSLSEMDPSEEISSHGTNTVLGLPTPSEIFDYAEISTQWPNVPSVQEIGDHGQYANSHFRPGADWSCSLQ